MTRSNSGGHHRGRPVAHAGSVEPTHAEDVGIGEAPRERFEPSGLGDGGVVREGDDVASCERDRGVLPTEQAANIRVLDHCDVEGGRESRLQCGIVVDDQNHLLWRRFLGLADAAAGSVSSHLSAENAQITTDTLGSRPAPPTCRPSNCDKSYRPSFPSSPGSVNHDGLVTADVGVIVACDATVTYREGILLRH